MALKLAPKGPGGTIRYSWEPPILSDDALQSATLTVTSGTVAIDSYSIAGDVVSFFASGGADGETTVISASAVTAQGETLTETLYIPVLAKAFALSNTVRDVCNFALRPIAGLGATPTADELADAQEHLDDMLAEWNETGADLGVKLPTTASDTLLVSDAALSAIKHNLRVRLSETYGQPVTQQTYMAAMRGIQQVKTFLLPDERDGVEYY